MARARQAIACARKVGLGVGIYLITGIPGETAEDVEASVRFIRETHPQDVQVSPLAVYPGTQVWARLRAQGQVSPDFFRTSGDAEVFARVDAHTERALRRLEAEGEKAKRRAAYGPEDFAAQKAWLGYCAVTNLLCGEALEAEGHLDDAEAQYAEIIAREPGSTWGFLKRALLRQRRGQRRPAREDLATPASWGSPISTRAAIEAMPAGCIAVVDAMGVTDAGIFGDILCSRMVKRGITALVTGPDGRAISVAFNEALGQIRFGVAPQKNDVTSPAPGHAPGEVAPAPTN